MKYRAFIEDNFLIDDVSGALVPFKFNKTQKKYYDQLCHDHDIEHKGLSTPVRELILKARKEGFTSLVLGLFAADDILQENPTESEVVSYKDEATIKFRKRYRIYCLSYYAKKLGWAEDDRRNPVKLETIAKQVFAVDSDGHYELRHNRATFDCGTASARTGSRGGTKQKILYSEAAHYPDTEKITAREIIEGGSQQMAPDAGWIFVESTGNGPGNYFYRLWDLATKLLSNFKARFFGAQEFYSDDELKTIEKGFVDREMFKQEYPRSPEDAFVSTTSNFTTRQAIVKLEDTKTMKQILGWLELEGTNYIDQAEIIKEWVESLVVHHPRTALYVGIDVAKSIDSTVATALAEFNVLNGGLKGVAIDSTGAGDYLPDWLERNTRWFREPVKFTALTKDMMYKNLQQVMMSSLTKLPELDATTEGRRFLLQMLNLQKEIRGNLIAVHHPAGEHRGPCDKNTCFLHDDYPDSWALAEHMYVKINGLPKVAQKPKAAVGLNDRVGRLLGKSEAQMGRENEVDGFG